MPQIDVTAPALPDILAWQKQLAISDNDLGRAIIGEVSDPGAIVRSWKSGAGEPNKANLLAFKYLRALWDITVLNPGYGEEIYARAFSALPAALQ